MIRRQPTQPRAIATYNAIVDACPIVLRQNGYTRSSMIDIAHVSGVAVPTIYQYFETKEAIFQVWMERLIETMIEQANNTSQSLSSLTPESLIDKMLPLSLDFLAQYKNSIRPLIEDLPHLISLELRQTIETKILQFLEQRFGDVIQEARKSGHTKIRILIRLLVSYFITAAMRNDDELSTQEEAKELAVIVKLYLKDAGMLDKKRAGT